MDISYFKDTDTLYIEFRTADVIEALDLDEETLVELDGQGGVIALTMEHASERFDISHCELSGFD